MILTSAETLDICNKNKYLSTPPWWLQSGTFTQTFRENYEEIQIQVWIQIFLINNDNQEHTLKHLGRTMRRCWRQLGLGCYWEKRRWHRSKKLCEIWEIWEIWEILTCKLTETVKYGTSKMKIQRDRCNLKIFDKLSWPFSSALNFSHIFNPGNLQPCDDNQWDWGQLDSSDQNHGKDHGG